GWKSSGSNVVTIWVALRRCKSRQRRQRRPSVLSLCGHRPRARTAPSIEPSAQRRKRDRSRFHQKGAAVTQIAGSTNPVKSAEAGARVEQLDSLRGLAALSVVFHHHLVVYPIIWEAFKSKQPGPDEALLLFPPAYL